MRTTVIPLVLFAMCASAQRPQWPPEGMNCEARVVVRLEPGPNIQKAKEIYPGHVNFIRERLKDGSILMAGPSADGTGLAIFKTADVAEVEKMIKNDPFNSEGVFVFKTTVWQQCTAK